MKHRRMMKPLAAFLALLMLFSMFSIGAAAEDGDMLTGVNQNNEDEEELRRSLEEVQAILSALKYEEYLENHKDAAAASSSIVIDSAAYDPEKTTAQVEVRDEGGRQDVLYTPDRGKVNFRFSVPQTALYTLKFDYLPTGNNSSDIERILYLDGEVPFTEARYLTMTKIWADNYSHDENGNVVFDRDSTESDIRPSKAQQFEWSTYQINDSTGYYVGYMQLYLEQGEHEITLEASRDPVVIDDLRLEKLETLPTYEEVKASYEKNGYTAPDESASVRINAEKPTRTSSNTISATYDRSSAITDPQHPSQIRYNTIGNSSTWNRVGTWVEWEAEVPQDGLYRIYTRFRQNVSVDMFSSRCLYIDGEIPFEEAKNLRFEYGDDWQVTALNDGKTEFEFYLKAGHTYTFRLEVVLGEMAELVSEIQDTVTPLNEIYLKILQITGNSPDEYQDYGFMELIPDYIDMMLYQSQKISSVMQKLQEINGTKGNGLTTLEDLAKRLDKMGHDEDEIAKNLKQLKTDIGSLGTWILSATEQPLEIDYLQVQSLSTKEPQCDAGMFQVMLYEIKQFVASFYSSYNNFDSDVTEKSEEDVVTVWFTGGRDQAQVFNRMLRDMFTAETGITVDMKLTVSGAILPAVLAGTGPDVTELDSSTTINWAIRNALLPIEYDDLDEVKARFSDQAMIPFTLYTDPYDTENGTVYGIPTSMSFSLMYYRMDVLAELGLEIPNTWDELKSMLPVVQSKHMDIGIPAYSSMYMLFLYQSGDENTYWADGGMRLNIDDPVNLSCFQDAVEMYTQYAFPLTFDFVNRFRVGEMPIGFADYTSYTYLRVFATEIRDLWEFTEMPGMYREDGTYCNTNTVAFGGISILHGAKNPDLAWRYIKWWTDEPAQTKYGNELEAILGTGNRYATSNIESLQHQSWSTSEYSVIFKQMLNLKSTPEYPGSYIIGRYMDFAFNNAYNEGEDPVELILGYLPYINKEITRKRKEFGLDYLELNETMAERDAARAEQGSTGQGE